MNDFDDRLAGALRADDIDSSRRPGLDDARRSWRRRRQRRLAGMAGALSVLVVGAGFGIALLAQNDPTDRVVTDSVSTVVPAPTTVGTATPTTLDTAPTTVDSAPVATEPTPAEPPTTATPDTTETAAPSSTAATDTRGLDVATEFVARTTVFDIDNRLEVRSRTNEVLWSYQYCDVELVCTASVQTVLDDGFWVLVGAGLDEFGIPTSSTLRRVGIDGVTVEVRAEAPAEASFLAAQPTVLGDLVAVSVRGLLTDITITDVNGAVTELVRGVSGVGEVEVSADGRYVAITTARPPEDYGRVYFSVFDLVTGQRNDITLEGVVTAAPIEFSADGSQLVMRNTWEFDSDFIIDPWADSPTLVVPDVSVGGFAICLVDDTTAAVASWQPAYSETSATTGTVRLVDVSTGDVISDLGMETFGRQLSCDPNGSVTFVRVPLIEDPSGSGEDLFIMVRPDFAAPVDVVRVAPDGTQTVLESGAVDISTIR